jgi:hypothetical protein
VGLPHQSCSLSDLPVHQHAPGPESDAIMPAFVLCCPQVYVFKKKKRKRYSTLQGHRSHITALRILEVRQPAAAAAQADAALAGLTNVAAIGPNATAALTAVSGRSQQQLQYPKQPAGNSSRNRPHAVAQQTQGRAAAAEGALEEVLDAAVAAAAAAEEEQPQGWQKVPRRAAGAGRQHGPPAVLAAVPKPEPRAKAAAQQ